MNEETEIPEVDPLQAIRDLIKIERSIVYNKRIAPAGYVFFVGRLKYEARIYTFSRIICTAGTDEEGEKKIKELIKDSLMMYLKSVHNEKPL